MVSTRLQELREWFGDEIRWAAGISDDRIVRAFQRVSREAFLPPGPWLLSTAMIPEPFRQTPDEDPRHLYHNVVVAIDAARDLSSALPSYMAALLEHSGITPGARVAHIGAGLGYYTALIAEMIGDAGSVVALELDSELASQARTNLASYSNASCLCGDGSSYPLPRHSFDVVIVSAGASQLQLTWLNSLSDGGRLLVPLVFSNDEPGQVARITRHGNRFAVEFVMDTFVYPCHGSDDQIHADSIRDAVETFGWYSNTELRLDVENADDSAWLVTSTYWISMMEHDQTHTARSLENSLANP